MGEKQAAGPRFGLAPAQGGLRLVQSLINTALTGRRGDSDHDYLVNADTAGPWLERALAEWAAVTGIPAPEIKLRQRDLAELRQLRDTLRVWLQASAANSVSQPVPIEDWAMSSEVRITIGPDGQVRYEPVRTGVRALVTMISTELLLAQAAGTLRRLKTCAASVCGACFYDASPNCARVWHDTKICGFPANLRASRARRGSR